MVAIIDYEFFKRCFSNTKGMHGNFINDMITCSNIISSQYKGNGFWSSTSTMLLMLKMLTQRTYILDDVSHKWIYLRGAGIYGNRITTNSIVSSMSCLYNNMEILRSLGVNIDISAFSDPYYEYPDGFFSRENKALALQLLTSRIIA